MGVCFGHELWYPVDMVVIVLTGGIGSGKTFASEYFARRGALVIDLDQVAARAMAPGTPVLAAVVDTFGAGVLKPDGSLDREALAMASFGEKANARRLDDIVHPAVAEVTMRELSELALRPEPPEVVIVEVPLLAEAPDFARFADVVCAITGSEAARVDRAVGRGMDRADVLRRVSVQAPDSERVALADVVIDNDGTIDEFIGELDRFWEGRFGYGGAHD